MLNTYGPYNLVASNNPQFAGEVSDTTVSYSQNLMKFACDMLKPNLDQFGATIPFTAVVHAGSCRETLASATRFLGNLRVYIGRQIYIKFVLQGDQFPSKKVLHNADVRKKLMRTLATKFNWDGSLDYENFLIYGARPERVQECLTITGSISGCMLHGSTEYVSSVFYILRNSGLTNELLLSDTNMFGTVWPKKLATAIIKQFDVAGGSTYGATEAFHQAMFLWGSGNGIPLNHHVPNGVSTYMNRYLAVSRIPEQIRNFIKEIPGAAEVGLMVTENDVVVSIAKEVMAEQLKMKAAIAAKKKADEEAKAAAAIANATEVVVEKKTRRRKVADPIIAA